MLQTLLDGGQPFALNISDPEGISLTNDGLCLSLKEMLTPAPKSILFNQFSLTGQQLQELAVLKSFCDNRQ